MATATAEHKASTESKEHKPQNPVHALVADKEPDTPKAGSWQEAFLKMADELDATGNQLGHLFREVATPLVEDKPKPQH